MPGDAVIRCGTNFEANGMVNGGVVAADAGSSASCACSWSEAKRWQQCVGKEHFVRTSIDQRSDRYEPTVWPGHKQWNDRPGLVSEGNPRDSIRYWIVVEREDHVDVPLGIQLGGPRRGGSCNPSHSMGT